MLIIQGQAGEEAAGIARHAEKRIHRPRLQTRQVWFIFSAALNLSFLNAQHWQAKIANKRTDPTYSWAYLDELGKKSKVEVDKPVLMVYNS